MAKIHLLPWREELRKQKKRDFLNAIALSIMATIGILMGVYFYIEGIKEYQQQRNKRLENEIAILDKRIDEIKSIEDKKKKLLAKIDVIQKLQESRPEIVHLFDETRIELPISLSIWPSFRCCRKASIIRHRKIANAEKEKT